MTKEPPRYCLDSNVLIQAWRFYYSPDICADYWEILNKFGKEGRILLPNSVFDEITKVDDDLTKWIKKSDIRRLAHTERVIQRWREIQEKDPLHKFLVDNIKQRSLADPWIIAHAMDEGACVVTKENKETARPITRIKIPNVCDSMGVRWINDFQLAKELGIRFSCRVE